MSDEPETAEPGSAADPVLANAGEYDAVLAAKDAAGRAVAVLTRPRGELLVGQLVAAETAAIEALVAAGGGRRATAVEIVAADTFIHDLPGA